jgi:hypothetical protein
MLRTIINLWIGILQMCRYRDVYFNRVLAPEGESLSFASPKERNQRKGDPMPLASCALAFLPGFARRDIPVPLAKRGIPAAPLRAIPGKNASARRGIRELPANCVA